MLTPIAIALILNSLTLTVALGLLILLLWHDSRRLTNLYFAWFLFMVIIWSAGSLLARGAAVAGAQKTFVVYGLRMLEIGFTNSALALYLYTIVLSGSRSRQFQFFAVGAVLMLSLYHLFLMSLGAVSQYTITASGLLQYSFNPNSVLLFIIINLLILVLVWQGFRKIQRPALAFGMMLFCLGQLSALLSPRLQVLAVGEDAGAFATLVMAFALIQSQIMQPLSGQSRQIEVVRDVGLAITSRLRLQGVLETIAAQAAALLRADASVIFLRRAEENVLILAAQYNVHQDLLGHRLEGNTGLVGRVALERRPYLLLDYRREWRGVPDTPFADQGFGSVIAVPLIFADTVVGVLLVVNGVENRLFEQEDVRLLELLAPQAAVAITNSRLFEQERALKDEVNAAKTQLEAFLLSTDNPVIALDKHLRIIFANEAASMLIEENKTDLKAQNLFDLVPHTFLPHNPRQLVRDLKTRKSHIYELEIGAHTYMCHLARIEQPDKGWVAVLNDVTSLKELDRLKRQMIELTTHQLKNPLQGAMLHLDELQDLGNDVLDADMQHDIDVIWAQLERMNRLIEGILNLERIQSRTRRKTEEVDLAQLTQAVVNHLQDLAQTKHIKLELVLGAGLPLVVGDPEELREVVSNLVDNAIKYSPQSSVISIDACAQDGDVLLKVKDSGIGIPPEAHNRVFERFFRVEQSGMEQIGGTGMGLSLVKAIVESHRGRVWLESQLNQGTTFYVSLPGIN